MEMECSTIRQSQQVSQLIKHQDLFHYLYALHQATSQAAVAQPRCKLLVLLHTQDAHSITLGNKAQVFVVYAAILADIFVTAYTDTLHTTDELAIILLLR